MDNGIIGGVITMPSFKAAYGLSHLSSIAQSNLSANLVSVMQCGAFAGELPGSDEGEKT